MKLIDIIKNSCVLLGLKNEFDILKDLTSEKVIFSRFEVIKYMTAKTKLEDIHYYGVSYDNSPNFDEATKKIQAKVKRYYSKHFNEIEKYNNYSLEYVPILDFVKMLKLKR